MKHDNSILKRNVFLTTAYLLTLAAVSFAEFEVLIAPTGTYVIEDLSASSTALNIIHNGGFDLSVARYETPSGSVAVSIPLLMLLEKMDPQTCR